MMRLFLWLGMLMLSLSQPVNALADPNIPEPLKPWVPWVLEDVPQWDCPFWYQNFQQKRCHWPGALHLTLQAQGGHFETEWTLHRPGWVMLPGDAQHWPQQVTSQQRPLVVVERQGKPGVWLQQGHHPLEGRFNWQALPEQLHIPEDTGLLTLSVNDKTIAYPHIEQSALWLNTPSSHETQQSNSLDLQVFRQIIDDIPLQIVTVLELQVSGSAREITLAHALLPSAIPINLESPLPARLEANGELRIQVRPGRWSLTLIARLPEPVSQLTLNTGKDWPESELWAFQAMPALRLVEIENLPAIDGSQTNLPDAWRHLPSYRISSGQSMGFKTLRRGDPDPAPNQLTLQRTLWLDFDGTGYTVSDRLSGAMTRDWRLNVLPEMQLGQALLNGQQQLITRTDQGQGLEVRRGQLQLQADSRLEADISQWHAVGWQQTFQQVRAELNIPPGWRLLAVSGVDNDPDCWLSQWTLLDVFLLLVIALATSRLWSWHWGVLALLGLTLIWQETEAPRWIWLNTLAALALLQALPENQFSGWVRGYRNLCWLALLAIVIPFMINQIRIGLYPQLAPHWPAMPVSVPDSGRVSEKADLPMQAMDMAESLAPAAPMPLARQSQALKRETMSAGIALERIDPDAQLQTGPGLPTWQWHRVALSWNGSVDPQQSLRLWYVSPFANLCLHLLQAILTALMTLKLLGILSLQRLGQLTRYGVAGLILPLLLLPSPDSHADYPDTQLLEQLKQRLQHPPECLPSCAQVSHMNIVLVGKSLQIEQQLHAQENVAIPLPARVQQWLPQHVSVDGHDASGLIREDDNLWLVLTPGVHTILLQGPLLDDDKLTLALPLPPHAAQIKAEGWRVDGVYDDGNIGPQLEFNRLETEAQAGKILQTNALPPFVSIERTLHLGLDWRVTTQIRQLGDSRSPVMLEVPLLPGEAVTDASLHVKNGLALINMAAGQNSLSWESRLDRQADIRLQAASTPQWHEIWRADVSPLWHLQSSELDVVHHQDPRGSWLPEWHPWPGESLNLKITRPPSVAGPTLTIDNSTLRLKAGKRSEQVQLSLSIRSSKGGQHGISLPANAVLQSVSIDGLEQTLRQQDSTVILPIHPGTQHITLNWQTATEQAMILTTPTVDLHTGSVNSQIETVIGEDRWVLMTLGPRFGPAALIWGLLIVLAVLAWALGHVTLTPLKHWQWFLLLIGLSQVHIAIAMLVVCWLLALGWRQHHSLLQSSSFNVLQVTLGLMTLMALWLLFLAVQQGLLGSPDMQITGNQSTAFDLKWYQDHSASILPTATVINVSLMGYRILMLLWSLWMALSLLNWLKWGWECFSSGGLWRETPAPPAHDQSEEERPG